MFVMFAIGKCMAVRWPGKGDERKEPVHYTTSLSRSARKDFVGLAEVASKHGRL